MTNDDIEPFAADLMSMLAVLSHGKAAPDGKLISQWFRVLKPYPLDAVLAGMQAHLRAPDTARTLPIPADIIKQINGAVANDGRPGADEAWAIAVQSVDEGATVVWTAEIAEAWGAVRSVMALGDEVGARVAFRDAYNRIVHAARCARRPMEWSAALGTDKARQVDGIRRAVELGRLPMAMLAELQALPAPRAPLLLGSHVDGGGKPSQAAIEAMKKLRELRERLAADRREYRPSADASAKQATANRRAEVQMQTADYLAQQPGGAAG